MIILQISTKHSSQIYLTMEDSNLQVNSNQHLSQANLEFTKQLVELFLFRIDKQHNRHQITHLLLLLLMDKANLLL